jgi:hypothetical protein
MRRIYACIFVNTIKALRGVFDAAFPLTREAFCVATRIGVGRVANNVCLRRFLFDRSCDYSNCNDTTY